MTDKVFNVLFLCTGNSARSVFAECIVNRLGRGKCKGYSAGSHPKGEIHPYALAELSCAARIGRSSGSRVRQRWISCSPSVTVPRLRSAQSGLASR